MLLTFTIRLPGVFNKRGSNAPVRAKVAEVIDTELPFKSLRGLLAGYRHYAGVVYEEIQAVQVALQVVGTAPYGIQVGQVEGSDLQLCIGETLQDLCSGLIAALGGAACQENLCAFCGQQAASVKAQAAVPSGNENRAAGLIGNICAAPFASHFSALCQLWISRG